MGRAKESVADAIKVRDLRVRTSGPDNPVTL
jgi:hypothetical protein